MKVYLVQNRDGLFLSIFRKEAKAKSFVKKIGVGRWDEKWAVIEVTLDEVESWIMKGCESCTEKRKK